MEKFDKFVREYDYSKVHQLPKMLRRRLDALKKIQLEQVNLLHQYHKDIQDLEMKYEKLYQPLYEKRYKIVNGEHEPTEEECQLPDTIHHECEDQENKAEEAYFTPQEEKDLESQVKGIPGFWLGCLSSSYNFNDSIEQHDRNVLKYLKDVRLSYQHSEDHLIYKLEFVFDENPYFTNDVLTKTYHLKLSPDEKDPFSYEGFEVIKSEGCNINWNPGKNVMVKTVTVKQQNKRDGRTREKKKEVETDSFFFFFKPPVPPEDGSQVDEEMSTLMAVDFELGEIIRQNLIPRAPLLYSGHIVDNDEDDEDLDDEDEDDVSDEEYDSEIESSSDSLSKDA